MATGLDRADERFRKQQVRGSGAAEQRQHTAYTALEVAGQRIVAREYIESTSASAPRVSRWGSLRQAARVAGRILIQRLRRPDLTRQEEAAVVGRALGLALDASAQRRATDAMFDALRRYGPDLLRDLAWTTPERWRHYEARYGIGWDDSDDDAPRSTED